MTYDPNIIVDPTMASWRCLADKGGTPCLDTIEASLLSAVLALLALIWACSVKPSLESRYIPSHLVALMLKRTRWSPTRMRSCPRSFQCRLFLEKRMASVFPASKDTPLLPPQLIECVCVILYFYPATCGPKGHGSGGGCF